MNDYEWPTELDVDESEPASVSEIHQIAALRRIQEWNRRNRIPIPIPIMPLDTERHERRSLYLSIITLLSIVVIVLIIARWLS